MKEDPTHGKRAMRSVGYRIPDEVDKKLTDASERLHMSKNAVVIHALTKGVDQLVDTLAPQQQPATAK